MYINIYKNIYTRDYICMHPVISTQNWKCRSKFWACPFWVYHCISHSRANQEAGNMLRVKRHIKCPLHQLKIWLQSKGFQTLRTPDNHIYNLSTNIRKHINWQYRNSLKIFKNPPYLDALRSLKIDLFVSWLGKKFFCPDSRWLPVHGNPSKTRKF